MGQQKFLPGTGRGTSRRLVEGARHIDIVWWGHRSITGCAGGPPFRAGEESL